MHPTTPAGPQISIKQLQKQYQEQMLQRKRHQQQLCLEGVSKAKSSSQSRLQQNQTMLSLLFSTPFSKVESQALQESKLLSLFQKTRHKN